MAKFISSTVDIKNIDAYFKNIESQFKNVKETILIQSQKLLLENLQRLAPRNSGDYANSWKLGEITEDTASIITPMGNLFIILEFTGSPGHEIKANKKKSLKFVTKSGDTVFVVRVKDNKGFSKIPHAQPALELTLKALPKILKKELAEIF